MKRAKAGGPFRFRVSDAMRVPLRGHLLRLRTLEGTPAIADVKPGRWLRLEAPDGSTRNVRILAHSITGGRQTQKRLDETRELDVIVPAEDATDDGAVQIGWTASGPADGDERAA